MPTLMLVDGNSLTYRAFFALPEDLATASGQVTNAVFGFTSMLINLVRDHKPDGLVVARSIGRSPPSAMNRWRPTRQTGAPLQTFSSNRWAWFERSWTPFAFPRLSWQALRPMTSWPRWPSGASPKGSTY